MSNYCSSSFLVGKTINSIEIPKAIYFENGVFNPKYVTSNFDFVNNRVVEVCEQKIHSYDSPVNEKEYELLKQGGWSEHFDDGSIMIIKDYYEISPSNLILDNGLLLYDHTQEFTPPLPANRDLVQVFIFPILNLEPYDYKYFHILFRVIFNDPSKRKNICTSGLYLRTSDTSIDMDTIMASAIFDKQFWSLETSAIKNYSSFTSPQDFYLTLSFQFDNYTETLDPNGYRVEIKKIWFDNISPSSY